MKGWPPTRSRFSPGQSGNPGGRPKSIRLALRKAAKHSPRAIQFLVETMNDEKQDPFARIAAAKLILDRGLGKLKEVELPPEPVQEREVTPEEFRYLERVLTIDNHMKQGWRIPPELSHYEAALRILREPNPEDGLTTPQDLRLGQTSKQFPEDPPAQPAAVENGHVENGHSGAGSCAVLPPTSLPFGNWK